MNAKEILGKKYKTIHELPGAHGRTLSPEFEAAIGLPAIGFSMFVWGESGHGKTTFVMKLCKELNKFGQGYYNSIEQGQGLSLQRVLRQCGMDECDHHPFMIGDRDSLEEMRKKLATPRQKTRFVVIDSQQYMGLTEQQFKQLQIDFPHISFIIISQATNENKPVGAHGRGVRFAAEIKVNVRQGVAIADSRYGATIPYRVMPWVNKDVDDAPKKKAKAKADTGQLALIEDE